MKLTSERRLMWVNVVVVGGGGVNGVVNGIDADPAGGTRSRF